jgi:hypothetical protein
VQLAAAFAPASLLAGTRDCTERKPIQSEVVMEIPASKLAGKESGSKLHALQSFALRELSGPRRDDGNSGGWRRSDSKPKLCEPSEHR